MNITAQRVRQVAELALILEPILDKKGCTTRYKNLMDKPLVDFLIAAVNVGQIIEDYAKSVIGDGNKRMFSHFVKALEISNQFKAKKHINTGLLHYLFITIKVRLESNTINQALKNYIPVMQRESKEDVDDNIRGFQTGWSTSASKDISKFDYANSSSNYYNRQKIIYEREIKNKMASSHQTTKEAVAGFPTIKTFVEDIDEKIGLIKSFENTYNRLAKENTGIKVGILADLSASALFLYLSYQNPETYKIY